jgi:hypothetical protein
MAKSKKIVLTKLKTGASKHLDGKLRTDLVTPEMIEALARVLTYGADKYEDRNWEKGIPYMTSVGAAMRHLLAFQKGIDTDEESGLYHIDQAFLNLGMVVTFNQRGRKDLDNRTAKGQAAAIKQQDEKISTQKTFKDIKRDSKLKVIDGIYYHEDR